MHMRNYQGLLPLWRPVLVAAQHKLRLNGCKTSLQWVQKSHNALQCQPSCVRERIGLRTWVACVAEHADQSAWLQEVQRSLDGLLGCAWPADDLQGSVETA